MICRNGERAQQARRDIIDDTGNTDIEIVWADLDIQHDVGLAAQQITGQFNQVDILVTNAGLVADEREETVDGIEKRWRSITWLPFCLPSYFGITFNNPMKLASSMLPQKYIEWAPTFLISATFRLPKTTRPGRPMAFQRVCNIIFPHKLAKRTKDTAITTYSLHHGVVANTIGWASGMAHETVLLDCPLCIPQNPERQLLFIWRFPMRYPL